MSKTGEKTMKKLISISQPIAIPQRLYRTNNCIIEGNEIYALNPGGWRELIGHVNMLKNFRKEYSHEKNNSN